MILDRLDNAERYFPLNAGFAEAVAFLRTHDLTQLAAGRHDVKGDLLYVMMNRCKGRGKQGAKLESHRQYIDIQFAVSGTDQIGWKPLAECQTVEKAFDAGADFGLFQDAPDTWVGVPPGHFAIFFPEDAHAPLGAEEDLVKAVMKVAVDWRA